ncbi:BlaI/MecI/CopY family transcriptional regulator [Christensenella tenuis]|jgi:BlaI family transcriptional regulator, penicillinase repressor|uniref:BlaI/MecI/CopY family transcriptional regulator n=1 Tax=Christensenella tenuis TaxID=2763033 RepID=A0ABR7EF63_9FIRM|nr:BlaI/MecI/CopY family transcriptional regulator [Christensenella tenuis]MBC5648410.1 BlaI/MecI/CopY family transcriptional regulator [Christensenella tenuis]
MKTTLTNPEWAVMSALWGKEPQTLSGVIRLMGDAVSWSYTTYATYLSKLCKKGFVGFELKGRDKFYYPLVEMDECIRAESRNIFDKMSEAGAKQLLVCMIREGKLSKEDQKELRELIDELSEGSE